MLTCPRCGEENPERARFCMGCSAELHRVSALETRRTVTIVFSDLVGSTALGERLDPEALREILGRYFDVMSACLQGLGGTVEKYIGDAIMAVFGLPHQREDDALRAATAALRMRDALVTLNDELERTWGVRLSNRTGLYTGEVVAGDPALGQRLVTGDAVNTAARLEQAAPTDEILIGEPTLRLVRHAVTVDEAEPVAAKGKAEPLPASRLIAVEATDAVARRRSPMVGRQAQLDALGNAMAGCIARSGCGLAFVIGDPGVGKSRLAAELVDTWRDRVSVFQGRCLLEGQDGSFWALTELVRAATGVVDRHDTAVARGRIAEVCADAADAEMIVERVASALGISSVIFPADEIVWGIRRLLEELATHRPLLLVVDDLQWAGAATLDAVAGIVDRSRDVPILTLCVARPELQDERASWIADRTDALIVDLAPLVPQESARLIADMVGPGALSEEVVLRIHEAAQGNPLFVEQTIASWLEDGVLVRSGPGWVVDPTVDAPPVPPSIRALLAARLDALRDLERAVVERGSVVGEAFPREAVAAMMPAGEQPIEPALSSLTTKRLLRPGLDRAGGSDWAFAHRLVRDAAYEGMLKRTRSTMHQRFAEWLQASPNGALPEQQGIVATHLETAFGLSAELGRADGEVQELGRRAASLLEAAAVRAREAMLHEAASSCYERAGRCRQPADGETFRLLSRSAEMAMWVGDVPRVVALAGEVSDAAVDPQVATRLRLVRLWVRESISGSENVSFLNEAREIVAEARRRGDDEGVAVALRFVARHLGWLGRVAESRAASLEAVAAARVVGRPDIERDAQTHYAMAAIFDGSPVSETIEWCRRTLEAAPDDRILLMEIARPLAILSAMHGAADDAEVFLSQHARISEELGATRASRFALAEATAFVAEVGGDHARVEQVVGPVFESLRAAGDTNVRASMAGLLAEAAIDSGDLVRALELAADAETVASIDDYDAQVRWRLARALALARSGAADGPVELCEEAVAAAAATEDVNLHGHALSVFAEVVRRVEPALDPRPLLAQAVHLFEEKGCHARATRARASLAELG